jgi:hypothetical protein
LTASPTPLAASHLNIILAGFIIMVTELISAVIDDPSANSMEKELPLVTPLTVTAPSAEIRITVFEPITTE